MLYHGATQSSGPHLRVLRVFCRVSHPPSAIIPSDSFRVVTLTLGNSRRVASSEL